ncbi:MAG: SGNH/GDSL hydrolase family protein [Solirubrobacterales bacterium]
MSWQDQPVIPELSGETREQFLADVALADAAGRIPAVFAKVGDSNTEFPGNLYGFGCRPVDFGDQEGLGPVLDRYNAVEFPPTLATEPGCTPTNSFSRLSAATRSGSYSVFPVTKIKDYNLVFGRPDPACSLEEIPLDCEIRLINPRYTIVMTGTNDLGLDINFAGISPGTQLAPRLALVVARIRQAGSVPILSNLPPSWVPSTPKVDEYGGIMVSNQQIAKLAEKVKVPVINLWRAMEEDQMVNRGLGPDGVHLSVYGGGKSPEVIQNSVNLTDEALRYGANRRNLIWLQTLAALDEVAASP